MPTPKTEAAGRLLDTLKGRRADSVRDREQRRDKVCVGPKYPGKPGDYAYRISESCTPKDPAKRRRVGAAGVSVAATKQEIRALERRLVDMPEVLQDVSASVLQGSDSMFRNMIRTDSRKRFPDPEQRWQDIITRLQSKNASEDWDLLPKRFIFSLMLSYLREQVHPAGASAATRPRPATATRKG